MEQAEVFQIKDGIAPGHPGLAPVWSDSAKVGVGTAGGDCCRVWFTLADGAISEVFFPQIDTAATRDLQFLVADGKGFFSEQRKDTRWWVEEIAHGIPAYRLKNTCSDGRYTLEQEIIADPHRSTLLARVRFSPIELHNPSLYILCAPHLANQGAGNTAWVGEYKGVPMLFAKREGKDGPSVLALACSQAFRKMSVGYVGFSDGWQDVRQNGCMMWEYASAPEGNVALTAEIETGKEPEPFVIAVGFGTSVEGAALNAREALVEGFDSSLQRYLEGWEEWNRSLTIPEVDASGDRIARVSANVLRTYQAKEFRGAIVASLSTPWGEHRGDGEFGYHMVWTRDLIEACGGLLAVCAHDAARRVLNYLKAIQEADGHWLQNMFVDGRKHWSGIQLDETGLPILLAFSAGRAPTIDEEQLATFWPMVRKAAGYLIEHGPSSKEGRWEQFSGYSAFTLSVEISALTAAADFGEKIGESEFASHARSVANKWNSQVENWIYVTGTELARRVGVDGYYAFTIPKGPEDVAPAERELPLNHWRGPGPQPTAGEVVSPDALALVRFGLRAPHDPRILNTIKVIDATLKVETPYGPCWRRFIGDTYGEDENGDPYRNNKPGIGRAWPLLTGERAHYEAAAGNWEEAARLMLAMEAFADDSGFLPEQIWDAPDIPEKRLFCGKATGSAKPLAWAHSEYLKLRRTLHDHRVFDMPAATAFEMATAH